MRRGDTRPMLGAYLGGAIAGVLAFAFARYERRHRAR
jgi:hypothetical protein